MLNLSVTQRINGVSSLKIPVVKQPRGGYINPRRLDVREFTAGRELHDVVENVHPSVVGMVVDYLTRVLTGAPVEEAFHIALMGAGMLGRKEEATALAGKISGLDDESITSACRLVNFDSVFRAGVGLPGSGRELPSSESISPDVPTCDNIRAMVERSMSFFEEYGPVVAEGMTFRGGYTETVSTGDGDFMTADALWDFKTNKRRPTSKHTLQVLMYWLMGLHSFNPASYADVRRLSFFNPRRGEVLTIDVDALDRAMLREVEIEVIGYSEEDALF